MKVQHPSTNVFLTCHTPIHHTVFLLCTSTCHYTYAHLNRFLTYQLLFSISPGLLWKIFSFPVNNRLWRSLRKGPAGAVVIVSNEADLGRVSVSAVWVFCIPFTQIPLRSAQTPLSPDAFGTHWFETNGAHEWRFLLWVRVRNEEKKTWELTEKV